MDERELVGLLYRADWARLSLAGSVCGAAGAVLSVFEPNETRDVSLDAVISRPPRLLTPETLDGDIAIDLAPGERFDLKNRRRVSSAANASPQPGSRRTTPGGTPPPGSEPVAAQPAPR